MKLKKIEKIEVRFWNCLAVFLVISIFVLMYWAAWQNEVISFVGKLIITAVMNFILLALAIYKGDL